MRMLVKISLSALALGLALPACAQPSTPAAKVAAGDADPALWVIKDADTTVYLFGTIHMLKPGLTWFDEAVKAAFDRSDTVVFEIVQGDAAAQQQLMVSRGINPTGPTLTEQLPAAKRAAVAKALGEAGLPQAAYDRMDPWLAALIASLTPIQKLGYLPENGPETVLAKAAAASGKTVTALETTEQQIGFFDGLSKPAQMQFLLSTVDELPKAGAEMGKMVDLWSRGNPDGLAVQMNDSLKKSPEVGKVLLTDRNARWAQWLKARMARPGTVFVAVGAGHLAGATSVQAMLGKAGVRAVRVKY
ncbi:TraB/GumN family protein [Sphingomonas sp.]|uniref:TraB/GumN family protein n=1 Tax=Sphingomonas sp. TaxID=28214 RepID=UPI002D808505|nr:TraB/GumN family protein [Sphingomonas sp.]HEU0044046.1 TraB/GumN family protein [Sphingomonas sp.]